MVLFLLLLALRQEESVTVLLERLGSDDVAVREQAVKALSERGPSILPEVLSLYRSTASAEVRSRTAEILRRFPFLVYSLTDPKEPLHGELGEQLLRGLKDHVGIVGCWKDPRKPPTIDAGRLRIQRQSASGHGQSLALDRIVSGAEGSLTIRRIAYQGKTPYRPSVKEEGARVEESTFNRRETEALVGLLTTAAALEPTCAIPRDPGKSWASSGSFSIHFKIESAGAEVWSGAFTGYASSETEKEYLHPLVLDWALDRALAHRSWTPVPMLPEDHAWALRWMEDRWAGESWWMREDYLALARFVGDETYLLFLQRALDELEGEEGPSHRRQRAAILDALSRIDRRRK
jgi:hypothetical protein